MLSRVSPAANAAALVATNEMKTNNAVGFVPEHDYRMSLDNYIPLDSHAKLFAREYVRTFEERRAEIYKKLVDVYKKGLENRSAIHVPEEVWLTFAGNGALNTTKDDLAIQCVRYRRMGVKMRCLKDGDKVKKIRSAPLSRMCRRRTYMICTGWGIIPAAWRTMTGAYVALMAVSVTSLLAQAPTQAANLANDKESLVDLEDWIVYFLQVMAFSLVVYVIVYVINLSAVYFRPRFEICAGLGSRAP
jgi:hypothetical protein